MGLWKSLTTRGAVRIAALMAAVSLMSALPACANLDESPTGAITPANFYKTNAQLLSGLASVYGQLRPNLFNYYILSSLSTDEAVVPVRGQDWYDNGKWLEVHKQTWEPSSAAGGDMINGAYNDMFTGVARANALIDALQSVTLTEKKTVVAETRALRAFYYYLLMDTFGPVPLVTDVAVQPRAQASRADIFKFVESELKAVRPDLPAKWDANNWGRLTQGAVDAILANMYLNAQVFTGTVTVAGLQPGTARWQDAVTTADQVLNSGNYSLAANWASNFTYDNQNSPENILVVRNSVQGGLNFIPRSLHYNSFSKGGGWNGFSTLAETFNSFDSTDVRRQKTFLYGPQFNVETGDTAYVRNTKTQLVFTPEIKDILNATEGEGVRFYKFPIDPNHTGGDMGNDYPYFRLAEMYLIKAEALNELGQTSAAIPLINTLRARVFTPPKPLLGTFSQAALRDTILKERRYELTAEAKRRQDMIRMGKFTAPYAFKPTTTEAWRILYPIPTAQLQTNPMLKQNPGYP